MIRMTDVREIPPENRGKNLRDHQSLNPLLSYCCHCDEIALLDQRTGESILVLIRFRVHERALHYR